MKHYYDTKNKELNRYVITVPMNGEILMFKRYAKTEKEAKEDFLPWMYLMYMPVPIVPPEKVEVKEDPSFPVAYNE